MTLPDTSAWVEYLRGTLSVVDRRMIELLESGAGMATTHPVEMELQVGARSPRESALIERVLRSVGFLPFVSAIDFDGAVAAYRACRAAGITPRGTVDCMIATVAKRHDAVLLSADRDIVRIAEVLGIRVDPASVSR